MKKTIFLFFMTIALMVPVTYAQRFRPPRKAPKVTNLQNLRRFNARLKRRVQAHIHKRTTLPASLHAIAPYSIAQVRIPGHGRTLGSAWLAHYRNKYWAVMPYHIGGKAGSLRTIRVLDRFGREKTLDVTIALNGNAGFHSLDMSIAEIPEPFLKGNTPMEIAPVNLELPAYSVGFKGGSDFSMHDWIPMKRTFLNAKGLGLIGDRLVEGEKAGETVNLSGYCGAPLFQLIEGEWKVVGMHEGSFINSTQDLVSNLTFALDISHGMELLFEGVEKSTKESSRQLIFKGTYLGALLPAERVKTVEVIRAGEVVLTQEMRNYPLPYSDLHSELALPESMQLISGDQVIFNIQGANKQLRTVVHTIP